MRPGRPSTHTQHGKERKRQNLFTLLEGFRLLKQRARLQQQSSYLFPTTIRAFEVHPIAWPFRHPCSLLSNPVRTLFELNQNSIRTLVWTRPELNSNSTQTLPASIPKNSARPAIQWCYEEQSTVCPIDQLTVIWFDLLWSALICFSNSCELKSLNLNFESKSQISISIQIHLQTPDFRSQTRKPHRSPGSSLSSRLCFKPVRVNHQSVFILPLILPSWSNTNL